MNAETEITLDQYYTAVIEDIKSAFPVFNTVEFDRGDIDTNAPTLPALLLEITEFEDDDSDLQTEAWHCLAHVDIRVLLSFKTPNAKLECRKLAVALAHWLRFKRFTHPDKPDKKLPTGPVLLTGCYLDDFDELENFEVWRIEFTQAMTIGPSVFVEEGETPSQIYSSFSPDIGSGKEDIYSEVTA